MKKLVRFLLGWVRIRITGPFPERFLNLCGTEQLPFWDPERPDEGTLLLSIPLSAQKRSKVLAKKAFCMTETIHQAGLPLFLWNFRRRYALLAGMASALLCALILSQFVLVVDVTGNFSLPNSVILTELERSGFSTGCYGPRVDVRRIANELLLELPELSFCTINISGIRAEVIVREAQNVPKIEQRWESGDIIAKNDGILLDIDPLIGSVQAEEGQSVLKGEVLISGREPHYSGDGSGRLVSQSAVRAEGRVMAQTRRVLRASTPMEVAVRQEASRPHILWSLKFLKKVVKFGSECRISPAGCVKIKTDYLLTLPGGVRLPLGVSKTQWKDSTLVPKKLERASAEDFLRSVLEERLHALMGQDGEVLSRSVTFSEENGTLTAELEAACIEQIGVFSPHPSQEHAEAETE